MSVDFFAALKRDHTTIPDRDVLMEFGRQLVQRYRGVCLVYDYDVDADVVSAHVYPRYTMDFGTNQIFRIYGPRHTNGPVLTSSPPLLTRNYGLVVGLERALTAFVSDMHKPLFQLCAKAEKAHAKFMDGNVNILFVRSLTFNEPDDVGVGVTARHWEEALTLRRFGIFSLVLPAAISDLQDFNLARIAGCPFQVTGMVSLSPTTTEVGFKAMTQKKHIREVAGPGVCLPHADA